MIVGCWQVYQRAAIAPMALGGFPYPLLKEGDWRAGHPVSARCRGSFPHGSNSEIHYEIRNLEIKRLHERALCRPNIL